jgi:hypothetical protein
LNLSTVNFSWWFIFEISWMSNPYMHEFVK